MFDFSGIKAVIFDIDGTLMDSVGRIIKTMQLSFRKLGIPEPDAAAAKQSWIARWRAMLLVMAVTSGIYLSKASPETWTLTCGLSKPVVA